MSTPIIGITVDREEPGGYSKFPWLALRENYCRAVANAGGLPVLLPPEPERAEQYLTLLNGLIVSGGAFDIDPALFGATERHPTVSTKAQRTDFEWALLKAAIDRDLPVLGLCGGQQLMNVVLGGSLIQHIPEEIPDALAHEQPNPRDEAGHLVDIIDGTHLHRIVGRRGMPVNSAHHQAAKDVALGVAIGAVAPDGVIEAIESPGRRFCIGVQWHPEFEISDGDRRLFGALIDAARS
jgi:putative glutamine amidotransferase